MSCQVKSPLHGSPTIDGRRLLRGRNPGPDHKRLVPIEAILPGDIVLAAVTDVPDQPWTEVNPTNPLLQPQGTPPHDLDTWDPEAAHRQPQPQDHVFVL